MKSLTNELEAKLLAAHSAEEAAALLRSAGVDKPLAERIWQELAHQRASDDKELSLNELEAVAGGTRDWVTEGCAATVEPGSWCWSNDHCAVVVEHYDNTPVSVNCPRCGTYFYTEPRETGGRSCLYYVCKACKFERFAYWNDSDKAK